MTSCGHRCGELDGVRWFPCQRERVRELENRHNAVLSGAVGRVKVATYEWVFLRNLSLN